jgi:N-glycosylase/DNA lyase
LDKLYQISSVYTGESGMRLTLNQQATPFDLESTLHCGQLFRWAKEGDWWYGVVEDKVIKARQEQMVLEFEGVEPAFISHYFRLKDNLPQIVSQIRQDPWIVKATDAFPGLRLVRQDPWECLVSYICATYKNIPSIEHMVLALSQRFGEEITFEDCTYHGFPEPETLAHSSIHDLRLCKLGFRAKRVKDAARIVDSRRLEFEDLRATDYETAREALLQVPGVGNKVADCVLLFSLDKLEAFPIDIWIKRVIQELYRDHFDASFIEKISTRRSLSAKEYSAISSFAGDHFGEFAGYAQEYLYHFMRAKGFAVTNLQSTAAKTALTPCSV